jgi:hypothetical protein
VTEEVIDGQLRANTWRTVRRLCTVAYFTVLVLFVAIDGIPTGRALIMTVVVAGLGIGCIGSGWRRFAGVIVDWLPFSAVLILYDLSRGVATVVHLPLHERDVASAESRLFGGVMPPVWLQNQLYDPNVVHWYDALATLVYFTHFVATPALAAVLWLRRREMWVAYITRVIALACAGLVTYVLFPEAPPWYAARDGVIDPRRAPVHARLGLVPRRPPAGPRGDGPTRRSQSRCRDAVAAHGLRHARGVVHRLPYYESLALPALPLPSADGRGARVHR